MPFRKPSADRSDPPPRQPVPPRVPGFVSVPIPSNLRECFAQIDRVFPEDEIRKLKEMARKDLAGCHFGLGLWIRNNWLYPEDSPLMAAISQAFIEQGYYPMHDNVSAAIVEALCLHANGNAIDARRLAKLFDLGEPKHMETFEDLLGQAP